MDYASMKPWKINTLLIGSALLLAIFPSVMGNIATLVMVLGTAVWAYFDARQIGIEKFKQTMWTITTRAWVVPIAIVLLWIVVFPMYVSWRYRALNGSISRKS